MARSVKPFVILAGQRTGSTWVATTLNDHPEVGCFGEMFYAAQSTRVPPHGRQDHVNFATWLAEGDPRRASRPREWKRWLDGLYAPRDDLGAVGFKLMYPQAPKHPWLIPALAARRAVVVHVVRANHLSVIVSQEMARARGAYHAGEGQDAIVPTVTIDPATLVKRVKRLEAKIRGARAAVRAGLMPVVELRYEDLRRDPEREFDRVFTRLGVGPAPAGISGEVRRLNAKPHSETIANHDEVVRVLTAAGRAHLLERAG